MISNCVVNVVLHEFMRLFVIAGEYQKEQNRRPRPQRQFHIIPRGLITEGGKPDAVKHGKGKNFPMLLSKRQVNTKYILLLFVHLFPWSHPCFDMHSMIQRQPLHI